MNTKKLTALGVLTSLALILFIIELRLPDIAPIPGMKLGLANIVTVYAVFSFTAGETAMLLTARILLGAVFSGNWQALIFSASGAVLCLLGMLILKKFIDKKYIWLCSIAGAVLHNIGQVCAAVPVMKTTAVVSYLPFLLISGMAAGAFTGVCAQLVINRPEKRRHSNK